MSEETRSLVERLRQRLHRTVRRLTLGRLCFGLVLTLGAAAALWLTVAAVEAGLWMQPGPRTALVAVVGAAVLGLFAAYVARPLLRLAGFLEQPSDEEAARRVGRHFPERVADRFVNLLQLAGGHGSNSDGSPALADHAVTRLGREVDGVDFEAMEDFSRARRASRWAVVPVAGLLLFLLAAPSAFLDASGRLLAPTAHFQRPAPFQLSVTPGEADLVTGDSLTVTVRAEPIAQAGALPSTVTLQTQRGDEEHVKEVTLSPTDSSKTRFRYVFTGARRDFRYRAAAEANGRPLRTAWHEARVAERPQVNRLQLTLDPPAYSDLPERELAPGTGDVSALPGTEVSVNAQLAGPSPRRALLRFSGGDVDTLSVEDGVAQGRFTLPAERGSYHLALTSASGAQNAAPIEYQLQPTSDAAPTVSLTAPAPGTALTDALRPTLRWQMSDDFGFAAQKLYWRRTERAHGEPMKEFTSVDVPVGRPGLLDQEVVYDWLLERTTDLDLAPGDVIAYYVRVWDNNRVAGYQSARTQTRRLRLPSTAEKYEQLDETQQSAEQQMQRLQEQSDEAQRQFEGLRESIRRKREGDWEDQRQVQQLKERQQKLQKGAKRLTRQIEKAARQMQKGQLTSPETQRAYKELQRVARQLQSPKLKKALQKLQKAMQEMNMSKMQQALKNFKRNEKDYQQRLKRAKELFEKLKTQQKLDEVARRAGELAEEEDRLAEETKKLEEEGKKAGKRESGTEGKKPSEGKKSSGEKNDGEKQSGEQKPGDENQRGKKNAERQSGKKPGRQSGDKSRQGQKRSGQKQGGQKQNGQRQGGQKQGNKRSAEKREQLAKAQERARKKMKKMRKEMQKLSKQMKNMRGAPKKQMQQMQKRSRQMPKQMKQNSRQLRQGQMKKARQGQQQMQKRLKQMQQSVQQMKKGMQRKNRRINVAGLRQALANTLRLSEDQEALRKRTGGLAAGSPALREVTRQQNQLAEGLRTTRDSLTALARNIPKMTGKVQKEAGEALGAMEKATEAMTGRNAQPSGGHQKTAMKNLNELALLLSDLIDQIRQNQSGGKGGGMSMKQMRQQLKKMSGQQKKLNGQVQQMLNQMQGDRLSQSRAKRLKKMAKQQKALRKQLQKMRKQGADGKTLGDLEKVADQMQKTIRQMQRGRLDRETLKRQQQIRSRLLQARQSLQKRGRKNQRRGREADEQDRTREQPTSGSQDETDRLRRSLIRSLESGYAPDYERLIKRYFELLEKRQQNGQSDPQP